MSDKKDIKTAAAYIRVSTDKQEEYSPESQLSITREHAAREGYYIPDEFVFYDDGISGKNALKREGFVRMISLAKDKSHPFEVIYVWKFSRFARNQEESLVYKNLLRRNGVSVVSVSEPLPDGPWGSLIERMIEWMDEYYLINLGTEVRRGMNGRAARGLPNVPPAAGYDIIDGKYVINADADVIRDVFRRFNSGESMRQIAAGLGAMGFRTRYGNPPDNRWVEYVLNNPCYIGKIRWSADGERHISRRDYDSPGVMTVDGKHEPVISQGEWERAQARLAEQKRIYARHARVGQSVDFMLKGLLRCSSCGATLTMCSGKARLQCHNYARGLCHKSHSVSVQAANEAVTAAVCAAVGELDFTVNVSGIDSDVIGGVAEYEKAICTEQRKLSRAKEAYLAGVDTLEDYRQIKAISEGRIGELEKKRKSLCDAECSLTGAETGIARRVRVCVSDILRSDDVSESVRNLVLRCMTEKIVFDRSENKYKLFFRT